MQPPGFLREKETKIKFDDIWKNMLSYKIHVFSRN